MTIHRSCEVEWINHAGFAVRHKNIVLVCDPWLDGAAFNDGWSLLSPSKFSADDFASVTHIWFSHEHPDHFSPKNLREIAPDVRARITVLFQETRDKKVVRFCRDLGFHTQELPDDQCIELAPDFRIVSHKSGVVDDSADIDSYLVMRIGDKCLVNVNDYLFSSKKELEELKSACGDITVLFTQFSYASWVGNPGDLTRSRQGAREKLEQLSEHIQILRPEYVVPFASFVWFSHAENYHMNESINKVGDVQQLIAKQGATPVVLYPGDRWRIGDSVDCQPALTRYNADYARIESNGPQFVSRPVEETKLMEESRRFVGKMRTTHSNLVLRFLPTTSIHLSDWAKVFAFDFVYGLREVPQGTAATADITMSAESLLYCFTTPWGESTLRINGRFLEPRPGSSDRFFRALAPAHYASAGIPITTRIVGKAFLRLISRRVRAFTRT